MAILTPLQIDVLETLFAMDRFRQHFYLTGGTALAEYYLQHRHSEDLDFFTHTLTIENIDAEVEAAFTQHNLTWKKIRSSPTFRRYLVTGELQIDIVRDIDFRVGAPELHGHFMIDTPKNIAVNKITAMYGRLEPKDYIDLYFLLDRYDFDFFDLFELGKNKDAGLEFFQWAKIIADVDTFRVLPRMIKTVKIETLQKSFHQLRKTIYQHLEQETR